MYNETGDVIEHTETEGQNTQNNLNNRADHHPFVLGFRYLELPSDFLFTFDVCCVLFLGDEVEHGREYKSKCIHGNSSNEFKDLVNAWDQDRACNDYCKV